MKLIIFAEISRTILDRSLCSFILLLLLNQGIFFGTKWYVSLKLLLKMVTWTFAKDF